MQWNITVPSSDWNKNVTKSNVDYTAKGAFELLLRGRAFSEGSWAGAKLTILLKKNFKESYYYSYIS